MEKEIRRSSALACGVLAVLAFGLPALVISCGSGKEWMEVPSFSEEDKTISAGQRFRMEPVKEGKTLLKNTGMEFEVKFSCTRLDGTEEVSYRTASHYKSKVSPKGGLGSTQTIVDQKVMNWPEGVGVQEVKIMLPFFPWEITSDKEGDVYFYMTDAKDGTVISNIILARINIKAAAR